MARVWCWPFVALVLAGVALADGGRTSLNLVGYVDDGAQTDTQIWFTFSQVDQRFVADTSKVADPNALMKALTDSVHDGKAVTVRYDPETAFIDPQSSKPTYVVRSVVYNGAVVEGDEQTPPRGDVATLSPREQAEFALGRAVAYAGAGDDKTAKPLLDKVLQFQELSLPLNTLALKTRGDVEEDMAMTQWPPGDARDRLLVAALGDARAWQQLTPNDKDTAMRIGWDLSVLGAYDEALAVYRDIRKNWPDNDDLTLRRIAALDRDRGNPAQALDDLALLAAIPGVADSMPYHYHRGWTLSALGRWDEAIAEFTAGLKFQPDYSGAFLMRACAYGAVGRLREALDDHRTAMKIYNEELEDYAPSPGIDFDNKRRAAVEQILIAAIAKDENQKITGLCDGYWDWGDGRRERSKLLPKP